MNDFQGKQELLLGKQTPVVDEYSPGLLYPIPRAEARDRLGLASGQLFYGVDTWYAYELSWLDAGGKPVVRVGRFTVPASSANMVESKSFKLYLNSLNNTRFAETAQAVDTIVRDISAVTGEPVALELFDLDDPGLAGRPLPGQCIDSLSVDSSAHKPDSAMLSAGTQRTQESLHSHLLRSLCPVTGQPDWASVWIHYRGAAIEHRSLLAYIIAYRQHQEFHEQCVERMFRDIHQLISPDFLHIQACYTRRGGLDINPMRSTDSMQQPLPRLNRQ